MHRIDHACIAVRNLYEGVERFRAETGLDAYDGGWNPATGCGQRIVPLGERTYLEINSVIDRETAVGHFYGSWYEAVLADAHREDRFMGWVISVDTMDELRAIADRIGFAVAHEGERDGAEEKAWKRRLPSGRSHRNENVPDDRHHRWPHGLPMFMLWPDESDGDHPDLIPEARTVSHRVRPRGIAWVEVGDEKRTRDWLGPAATDMDIRFIAEPAGLYAVGISTDDGDLVVRRTPAPLSLAGHYTP